MNDKAKELTPAENVLIEFTRYLKQRAELFREDEEDFHRRMNEAKSQEEAYEWASEAITAREKYHFAEHLLHELDYLEVLFGMRVLQDGERKPFGCTVKYFDEDDESDECKEYRDSYIKLLHEETKDCETMPLRARSHVGSATSYERGKVVLKDLKRRFERARTSIESNPDLEESATPNRAEVILNRFIDYLEKKELSLQDAWMNNVSDMKMLCNQNGFYLPDVAHYSESTASKAYKWSYVHYIICQLNDIADDVDRELEGAAND